MAVAGPIAAGAVLAQSGAEVVKAKGVSWLIAARKGDAGTLAVKLKDGKGHPIVTASDAELKSAVDCVLSQK